MRRITLKVSLMRLLWGFGGIMYLFGCAVARIMLFVLRPIFRFVWFLLCKLWNGLCYVWSIIVSHKIESALVVSMTANIVLMGACANKTALYQSSLNSNTQLIMENDSIRLANVRYSRCTEKDIERILNNSQLR